MTKEFENDNSPNIDVSTIDFDNLDGDALREKAKELFENNKKISDANRQLFVRTKKAEGFEQNEKGDWIKVEVKEKPKGKQEDKKGLDYSQKAYLVSKGIEEEFFGKVEEALESFGGNKDGVLEKVLANAYFKSELETLRAEKATRDGSPTGGGGSGEKGGKKSVEHWVSKGGLPAPDGTEETIRLRAQIVARRRELDRQTKD